MPHLSYVQALRGNNLIEAYELLKANSQSITPALKSFNFTISSYTILHLAAMDGNLPILIDLIENYNGNINEEALGGVTLLMAAISKNQVEVVNYLLNFKSINLYETDNAGNNIIHYAVQVGNLQLTKLLANSMGLSINQVNRRGDSPLMIAAMEGYLDIVKYLMLEKNVNILPVSEAEHHGSNCLILSIEGRHLDVVKFIFENKIILRAKKNKKKEDILEIATRVGDLKIIKYLFESFLEINKFFVIEKYKNFLSNSFKSRDFLSIKFILQIGQSIFDENFFVGMLNASIFSAVEIGDIKLLKLLIRKYGANVNQISEDEESIFEFAAKNGYLDIVRYLNEEEPRLDREKFNNVDKNIALILAVQNGHVDVVVYLIKECLADFNFVNVEEDNSLILAIKHGKFEIVKFLIEECLMDVRHKNVYGQNAIEAALSLEKEMNPSMVVNYLVKKLLYKNLQFLEETLAKVLLFAADTNDLTLIKFMLEELYVDHRAVNMYGQNIIQIALSKGHIPIVNYLLENSYFNLQAVDADNIIPLIKISMSKGSYDLLTKIATDPSIDDESKKIIFESLISVIVKGKVISDSELDNIRFILSFNIVDINFINSIKLPLITFAIIHGHKDLVKLLADEYFPSIKLEFEEEEFDIILVAIKFKMGDILEFLRHKVSEEYFLREREEFNIFELACMHGNAKIVSYLKHAFPDMAVMEDSPDMSIYSPIDLAINKNNIEVVKYLAQNAEVLPRAVMRIIIDECPRLHQRELSVLLRKILSENQGITEFRDQEGNTPLIMALKHGKYNLAYILMDDGADIEARNLENKTPLMILLDSFSLNPGQDLNLYLLEMVKFLVLDKKVNVPDSCKNHDIWMCDSELAFIFPFVDNSSGHDEILGEIDL